MIVPTGIVFRIIPEAAFASSGRTGTTAAIIDVGISCSLGYLIGRIGASRHHKKCCFQFFHPDVRLLICLFHCLLLLLFDDYLFAIVDVDALGCGLAVEFPAVEGVPGIRGER